MPVTLFFDIDGTLVDTAGAGSQAMRRALATEFNVRTFNVSADATNADSRNIVFAGRTDRSLISEHLLAHDLADTEENFRILWPSTTVSCCLTLSKFSIGWPRCQKSASH